LGDAIPKYPFFFFFRGFAAKKEEKNRSEAAPQSHETAKVDAYGLQTPQWVSPVGA
jgi:hypothetical protein